MASLRDVDKNHDNVLDQAEVTAGLRRRIGLRPGESSPELEKAQERFRLNFGPGPTYPLQTLASDPYFNPKVFGLGTVEAPQAQPDTVHLWIAKKGARFRVRRTLDDLMEPDLDKAKGALISYTNDFNSHSDQWSFHGIVGLVLSEEKNVHFGESPTGVRPPLNHILQGMVERWLIASVQWDKVNTSRTDKDEIDALISRVSTGFKYVASNPDASLVDGLYLNLSADYTTDSSNDRGIVAGELDIKPFKASGFFGLGLNESFQQLSIFRLRPELILHAEGGTVTNAGGDPALIKEQDFLRLGFNAGFKARFVERLKALRGLTFHTGLQYYVDVTNSGPDVDLFTASLEWVLDPPSVDAADSGKKAGDSHYTLSAEYRNGRAPLILQRDNRITIGLGVKF